MRKILKVKADIWLLIGLYLLVSPLYFDIFSSAQFSPAINKLIWFGLVLVTWAMTFLLTEILTRTSEKSLPDIPNELSPHRRPKPRGGGLSFVLIFLIISGVVATKFWPLYFPFFDFYFQYPILNFALLGFVKDFYKNNKKNVPTSSFYLLQGMTVLLSMPFSTLPLYFLNSSGSYIIGIALGEIVWFILHILFVVTFIKFYEFMDGLDGLVGSTSLIQLVFLSLYFDHPVFILLSVSLLGFLQWNWSPAKIFMGAVGSNFLGAVIAIFLMAGPNSYMHIKSYPDPFLFWSAIAVTFPLMGDATYTIIRRFIRRENIFKAHRSHLYQRLQQSGWPHSRVVLTYCAMTGVIANLVFQLDLLGSMISVVITILGIVAGEIYLKNAHS
ncbi:MAG: glycosyl transferase family 4 [Cyanobacteria bacterium P01_G01_bin.54]